MVDRYSDTDSAANPTDRKSVSRGVICLNGMIFGRMCRKQVSVDLSAKEAEVVASSMGAADLLGLKKC